MVWFFHANTVPITPLVSGVQDGSDPNHLTEIYYGSSIYSTASQMLDGLGVIVYPEDKFAVFPDPAFGLGSKLEIQRALAVVVTDAKTQTTYRTWQTDVQGLFSERGIILLGQDSAEPGLSATLTPEMAIKITRVAEVDVTETVPIDFKVTQKQSVDLEKGQTKIEIAGVKGIKENIYTIKRVDGEEVSKTLKSSSIVKESVTQVVIIGIGPKLAKSGPYVDIINAAAKKYLINGTALMCLMMAESGGHATSGYPGGKYQGLFQYDPNWWPTASSQAGYGGAVITDPTAQIFTTAYQLTHGQSRRWPPWTNKGCSSL